MLTASNIQYELSDRTRGLGVGGIGVMHRLTRQTGLIPAIDQNLHLLKVHLPYHESDHVMNVAYNALSGGTCLEDLELRRNDEVYLDALGAQRIPDPTTAGDFCRRFSEKDVETLMDTINEVRLGVWAPTAGFVLRASDSRRGRNPGHDHRRVQAADGYQLQGRVGLSSVGGVVGQHG